MKKLLCIFIAFALLFFAACSHNADQSDTSISSTENSTQINGTIRFCNTLTFSKLFDE